MAAFHLLRVQLFLRVAQSDYVITADKIPPRLSIFR